MKRTVSVILAALIALSAVLFSSCGGEEGAPDGMKKASNDYVSYVLYVPEMWQCDVASGATTAYYSNTDTSSVSVMTFSMETSDASAADWWKSYTADFETVYQDFEIVSEEETTLDSVAAFKVVYTGKLKHEDKTVDLKFMQVCAIKRELLSAPEAYVFTYTSYPETYDSHLSDVRMMLDNFRFN